MCVWGGGGICQGGLGISFAGGLGCVWGVMMGLNMDGGSTTGQSIVVGVVGGGWALKGSAGVWGNPKYKQPNKEGGAGAGMEGNGTQSGIFSILK